MNSLLAIAWPISETAVERLGWILIHSLWQFTLVALLAAAFMRGMRRRSSSARYLLLTVTMTVAVALPVVTWMLQPAPALIAAPAENVVIDQGPLDAPPANEPFASDNIVIPADRPLAVPHEDNAAVPANLPPAIPAVRERELTWSERLHQLFNPYLEWIVAGWSLGVIICALRPLFGWYTLRRLKRIGTSPVSDTIAAALKRISQELGITRTVRVMQSTLARVPVVVGYFRPVILLPASLLMSIPPEQLEAILAHELAHVRRHDFIINLLQTLIETLFFYHPAIWWMSRKIRIEREHCCDDLVITSLNNRIDYGRALVAIEELRGERTVLAIGAKDGSLLSRVRRIVGLKNDRPDHFTWTTLTGLSSLCFVLAGLSVLGWSLIAQTSDTKTTTVVMAWSAMVDQEVLAEIRDLADSDGDDATLHCSADELRAILARHADDDDEVLLSGPARIIPPTSVGFLRSGTGHMMSYQRFLSPKKPEYNPVFVTSHGQGTLVLQSLENSARLRLDMTYKTVFDNKKRAEYVQKFHEELPASNSVAFVVGSGEVAETNRSIIVIYEAITIPDDQLEMFKLHIPSDVWCRIGADGLKKRFARAADWQTRPSTALSEPNDNWTRHLDHAGHVQLVALGRPQPAPFIWWTPDGKPLGELRPGIKATMQQMPEFELAAIVRIWDDDEKRSHFTASDSNSQFQIHEFLDDFPTAPGSQLLIVPAVLSDADGQPSLSIGTGFGEWNEQTTVQAVKGAEASLNGVDIRFAAVHKFDDHSSSSFFWPPTRDHVFTAIAVTKSGQSVEPTSNPIVYANEPPNTKNYSKPFHHPIDGDSIGHFIIKSRTCQWIEFTDFAVEPAEPLNPPLDFDNPDGTEPTAQLPDNITVKLVGVGYHPSKGKDWWAPNGGKLDKQPKLLREEGGFSVMPGSPEQKHCREFLIHITGLPKEHAVHTDYGKSAASGSTYADGLWVGEHAAGPFEGETTSFRLGLTTEPFGPTVTIDAQGNKAPADLSGDLQPLYDHVAPKRVEVVEGKTTLVIDASKFNNLNNQAAFEIQAIDRDGNKIDSTSNSGYETESTYGFRLPLDQLDHFEYRMRPYRHFVTFENVSLEPGVMTDVNVKVESPPEPKSVKVELSDGVTFELVGVTKNTADASDGWAPNGVKLRDVPAWPENTVITFGENNTSFGIRQNVPIASDARDLLIRMTGLKEQTKFMLQGVKSSLYKDLPIAEPYLNRFGFRLSKPAEVTDLKLALSTVPWGPVQRVSRDAELLNTINPDDIERPFYESIAVSPATIGKGGSGLSIRMPKNSSDDFAFRIKAVDVEQNEYDLNEILGAGKENLSEYRFPVPPDRVDHYEYQLLPWRHFLTFENVSLEPGVMTEVKVKVESVPEHTTQLRILRSDGTPANINAVVSAAIGFDAVKEAAWSENPDKQHLISLAKLPEGKHWLVAAAGSPERTAFQVRIPSTDAIIEKRLRDGKSFISDDIVIETNVRLNDAGGEIIALSIHNKTPEAIEVSDADITLTMLAYNFRVFSPRWGAADSEFALPTKIEPGQTEIVELNWPRWVRSGLWASRNEAISESWSRHTEPGKINVRVCLGNHGTKDVLLIDPATIAGKSTNGPADTPKEGIVEEATEKAILFNDGRVISVNENTKYTRLTDEGEKPAERKDVKEGVRIRYELAPGKGAVKVVILPVTADIKNEVGDVEHITDPEILIEQLAQADLVTLDPQIFGGTKQQMPDKPPYPSYVQAWEEQFLDPEAFDPRVKRLIALGDRALPHVNGRLMKTPPTESLAGHLILVLREIGNTDSIPLLIESLRDISLPQRDVPFKIQLSNAKNIRATNYAATSALWKLTERKHCYTPRQWKQWWEAVNNDYVLPPNRNNPEFQARITAERMDALVNELAVSELSARERLIASGSSATPYLLNALTAEHPPGSVTASPQAVRLAWVIDELAATDKIPADLRQVYFSRRFAAIDLLIGESCPLDDEAVYRALNHSSLAEFCSICFAAERLMTDSPRQGRFWVNHYFKAFVSRYNVPPELNKVSRSLKLPLKQITPAASPQDDIAGAVPLIIEGFNDPQLSIRLCASKFAVMIAKCSSEQPEPLIAALRDAWLSESDPDRRIDFGAAMTEFATPFVRESISNGLRSDRVEIVSDSAALMSNFPLDEQTRPDFELLVELTRHENDELRQHSVRTLRRAPSLLEPELERLARDDVELIRENCIHAFGNPPDPKYADLLIQLADDQSQRIRTLALSVIGKLKQPEVMPRLVPFLRDEKVQIYAISSLVEIGGKDALPLLMSELESGNDVGGLIYGHLRHLTGEDIKETKPEPWLEWWKKNKPPGKDVDPSGENDQSKSSQSPPTANDVFARKVSLTATDMPLHQALRKLAQSASVHLQLDILALSKTELDLTTPVTVTIVDEPLGQAMLGLIEWNDYQGVIRELRKGELVITTIAARQERIEQAKASLPEEQRKLLKPGVHVEFDDDGQVVSISIGGASADELLPQLNLFPHLRELKISGTKSDTAESLTHLSELAGLQTLSLSEIGIDGQGLGDVALKQIVGLKSLRELSLLDCGVTDEGIQHLEDMPGLTRLEINGEGRLTDAAVASIAKLTRLKSLSLKQYAASERLGRMHFSSEATIALAELQELEHLNLVGQGISADALRFPRLKSLALGREHIDDAHAARIAECRELRSLTLVLTNVGDDGLNLIANLPELRTLELKSDVITDAGVAHLSRLKTLDHLNLSGPKLTDESLRSLAKIETLTRIDLNSGQYTVNGVNEFKSLPKLRTLWLMNFTADGDYSALNELTQLRELVFESADITQEELNALQDALPHTQMHRSTGGGSYLPDSKQKLLQVKPISEPSASNDGHAIPEEWKKLIGNGLRVELNDDDQIISLTVTDALSDEFLSQLKNVPTLRELKIFGSKPITREGLAHLAELSGLEKLVLSNLHRSGDGLGDAALEYVVKIKSLRELRMGNCGITDRGLQRIETMSGLTSLALSHEGRLTDGAIGSIVKLKGLKYLYLNEQIASKELGRMHFSAEATGLLTTLGELEHLHLIGQEISADALRFPLLESLSLGGRGPASLRLPQNGSLDDTHAARIAECRNLKSLNLTFCNVSDEGLNSIASLPSLERLEIVSPTVTDIGIKRLARLPMLNYIALDTPNISNVSMRDLAKMKSLEEIHLSSGNIQYTDLKALEPLPRLHTLLLTAQMLRAYTGSYAALGELTQLRTLILINNDPGGLTERELHALAKALPNVSIPQF